jgi:hypothetical protein
MVFAIAVTGLLALFATAVMSYISMAIPIGPWIAPTIVLLALGIFKVCTSWHPSAVTRYSALATAGASIGGILATGVGFSYPAIYFLDPTLFETWLERPLFFCTLLSSLALVAGALGIWLAHLFAHKLVVQEQLAFPIGALIQKMIAAHQSVRKSVELTIGFCGTALFCFAQDGIGFIKGILPKAFTLVPATHLGIVTIPLIRFDIWPLLWAIGFVTGHMIAIPLAVGAMAKILLIDPLNQLLFASISSSDFVLAFCSGLVLAGALQGFIGIPSLVARNMKTLWSGHISKPLATSVPKAAIFEGMVIFTLLIAYFVLLNISWLAQLYVVACTIIVTYQLAIIAGKMGLAPLGRFATFVMVPALFLFNLDAVTIIIIATFVEICGGVTADALFGIKMAQLGDIGLTRLKRYQYAGLCVAAASIGIIFWLLISHFGLGSVELFAQKAQARALLINARSFNLMVVIIGLLFGMALKYIKLNPALILSGILMPLNLSLGLIVGGSMTLAVHDKEEWYPFWSGVFASNSIWMLLKTL